MPARLAFDNPITIACFAERAVFPFSHVFNLFADKFPRLLWTVLSLPWHLFELALRLSFRARKPPQHLAAIIIPSGTEAV